MPSKCQIMGVVPSIEGRKEERVGVEKRRKEGRKGRRGEEGGEEGRRGEEEREQ